MVIEARTPLKHKTNNIDLIAIWCGKMQNVNKDNTHFMLLFLFKSFFYR